MKFKINRVKLIKELGQLTIDTFLIEFQKYCDEYLATKNNIKFDVSLLRTLCNILENSYVKKNNVDEKLDKKQTVIEEYVRLKSKVNIQYTPDDKKALEVIIEDLHNTGQIKKISSFKLWGRRVKNLLIKSA